MGSVPPLLTFLLVIVSGWVHRHQLMVVEFLKAENQILKERLRGKRIRFTDWKVFSARRNAELLQSSSGMSASIVFLDRTG